MTACHDQGMDSLTPDLDGTVCSVSDCLDVADVLGTIRVETPEHLGHPDRELLLVIPVCVEHGHQLREGGKVLDVGFMRE